MRHKKWNKPLSKSAQRYLFALLEELTRVTELASLGVGGGALCQAHNANRTVRKLKRRLGVNPEE